MRWVGMLASVLACVACTVTPEGGDATRPTTTTGRPAPQLGAPMEYPGVDAMVTLQASPLRLRADELSLLERDGFAISERKRFQTFADGWLEIYKADLPLFLTTDALFEALHRSYDSILKTLERSVLAPRLEEMLLGMREHLTGAEGASLSPVARADVDLFTSVALQLLDRDAVTPLVAENALPIAEILDRANGAGPPRGRMLFGSAREVDWSQFKPRGHYTDPAPITLAHSVKGATLADYFRAVMWLGRIDARIAEPVHGVYELQRRQVELAAGLRAVMQAPELAAWAELEATMNTFVGERDAMGPADIDRFYRDLGIRGAQGLASLPDGKIMAVIAAGHYGEQRILSHIIVADQEHPALLPKSFSFTGQRYTPDSHAFSDLVDDRVPGRFLPDPLDVAYTVLGNPDAKPLLVRDGARSRYASALEDVRSRIETQEPALWESSLYTFWLSGIAALSPASDVHLPPSIAPQPWGRRILSSQLASWAELRHDTILYAKQSYTRAYILCSYPDAFLDPYPAVYERLGRFADKGKALIDSLDFGSEAKLRDGMVGFFRRFEQTMTRLARIARAQARGEKLDPMDRDFINGAIVEASARVGGGCGGPAPRVVHGWYIDLFFGTDPLEFSPTIADVHTQPTDADGKPVGRVLHVATGQPRLIIVNLGDRDHVHPYLGIVSTFAQLVTSDFLRRTDDDWRSQVQRGNPEDVAWIRDEVVRE
jgi:hypothetical protein